MRKPVVAIIIMYVLINYFKLPGSFEGGQGSDRFLSSKSLNKLITSADGSSDDEGVGFFLVMMWGASSASHI